GKVRLALEPWVNHWWQIPFYVSARGLTTSLMHAENRALEIEFDFIDHVLWLRASDGHVRQIVLKPMSVAEFYGDLRHALSGLGIAVHINEMPNEIADAIPFSEDRVHGSYDRDYANRFWRILAQSHDVFTHFRTGFLGKTSPVHFFWGSFDLAVTRFSGRTAPPHPGGAPGLPDRITREAYSHEVSSAGFWPGGVTAAEPIFYSYAYPEPDGFRKASVQPDAARFDTELGEFVLPYEAVRSSNDPEAALTAFLQSTYDAAANLAKWDRLALEREPVAP
ncbi:MAG: DUF5996 family protein, partial [Sphingomicrobium sp.]